MLQLVTGLVPQAKKVGGQNLFLMGISIILGLAA